MLGRGAGVLAPVLFACAGADCISGLFQNAIPLRSGPVTASKRAFLRRRGSSCSSPHHACQCHCATQAMRRALGLGLLRQAEAVTATRQLSRAQCHVEGLSVSSARGSTLAMVGLRGSCTRTMPPSANYHENNVTTHAVISRGLKLKLPLPVAAAPPRLRLLCRTAGQLDARAEQRRA